MPTHPAKSAAKPSPVSTEADILAQRRQWAAQWCWTSAQQLTHPWNSYAYFRKSVRLDSPPRRALVRISADARYTLYVNGQRVHHGPARSFPQTQSYDTLDLAALLHPGDNVIAAIVHQFGAGTFQSVFRDASGFLLDGVIECPPANIPLHTPDGWRCRLAQGWRKDVARMSIQLGFQEHFDADADPDQWMAGTYDPTDEQGWQNPWCQGPVGVHPWLHMEPRGVPLLADRVYDFATVVAQFRGENPRGYKVVSDVYHLVKAEDLEHNKEVLTDPQGMLHDDPAVTIVPAAPEGQFIAATLDLGAYRTGHLMLDIANAAGDEIIDVLFSEQLEKSLLPQLTPADLHSRESTAMRYRCRPGRQRWEMFHFIGMRYVLVLFRNVQKPLHIRRIAVRQVGAAVEDQGRFECSDQRLNQIWKVGVETQRNCLFDAFVDCPWREQAMWWGDARVQGRVTAFAFGDYSVLERGIRLMAQSQGPDGALQAHPPSDSRHYLPDFMLTWIGTLWDHYFYTAKFDVLRQSASTLHRLLDFFTAHENTDGLIGGFAGFWMFLDWQNIYKADYSAPFNLLYLQALRQSADICRLIADPAAVRYADKAAKLQTVIEQRFWDEHSKLWRDGFDPATGKQIEQTSQHTNTLAILLGLKPPTHAELAGGVLLKAAQSRRTKILTASPFFYAYVLEALAANNLRQELIDIIRDKWGDMIDKGADTFWELWEVKNESRCHAWSASPVYHLMQQILGVTPSQPGWRRVRIAPFPADLEFARGVVPSPLGPICVEWEKLEDQLAVRVDLPRGMNADFVTPAGQTRELGPGAHEFHT